MHESEMKRVMDAYRKWYEAQIADEQLGSLIPTEEAK